MEKFTIEFDADVLRAEIRTGILRQLQGNPTASLMTPLANRAAHQTAEMIKAGKFDAVITEHLEALKTSGQGVIGHAVAVAFQSAVKKRAGQIVAGMVARGEIAAAVDEEIRRAAAGIVKGKG